MSSTATTITHDLNSFSYAQVAVAVAVLYDHGLTFAREIDYIWRRPPSLVSALYLLDRYVGDSIVILGVYLCLTEDGSIQEYDSQRALFVLLADSIGFTHFSDASYPLFQVRGWGTLLCSWLTQSIMQLRIYAMYRRTRWILTVLLLSFFSEVLAVIVIIWTTNGPESKFVVIVEPFPGKHLCSFTGINTDFVYLFIPILCFETLLFFLAIRVSLKNMRERRATPSTSILRINSFMSILVRDSILYFFINLAKCAIVMGLWRNASVLRANISIPFIMLLETMVGTRVVINFKEHCSRRLSSEPVMITGSIRFAGVSEETARQGTIHDQSNEDNEMQLVKGFQESTEVIVFEEI